MIYARQIAPEWQDSHIFDDDGMGPDYICVTGNRDYMSHTSSLFDRVYNALEDGELADCLDNLKEYGYKSTTEALNGFLWPEKPRYSTRDIHALKELVTAFTTCRSSEENDIFCKVLSIVTGDMWEWSTIRGCSQSEWNEVFYPVKYWSRDSIEAFETMYFNTGSEWIIHDEETIPGSPEEINGYSVYCVAWNEDGIKKEIANIVGGKPEEVRLYSFERWEKFPIYKAV